MTAILVTISAVFTSKSLGPIIFAILFLPVTAYFVIEFGKEIKSIFSKKSGEDSDTHFLPRKAESLVLIIVFALLFGFGFKNVIANTKVKLTEVDDPSSTNTPLIFKAIATPSTPLSVITVAITDGSPTINIRNKPTIYSDKITTAKDGDKFEVISKDSGWYLVKIAGNATDSGYISAKYIKQ